MSVIQFGNTANTCVKVSYSDPKVLYLKKEAETAKKPASKTKGESCAVSHFKVKDMKAMVSYFIEKEAWLTYLIFTISCNTARRAGDVMNLTWEHFYNPKTGNFRCDIMPFVEQKTGKTASPRLNDVCKDAINLYLEKSGCDPTVDNYSKPICLQYSGTHRGKKMSYSGYYKAIKRAAEALGIEYSVGTHSCRKTFGRTSKVLHPNDPNCMETIQAMLNHSDTKVTMRYIGLEKDALDRYVDDMGRFYEDYVLGDKEYKEAEDEVIVHLELKDLRNLIHEIYYAGISNAAASDPKIHTETVLQAMSAIDQLKK